MALTRIERNQLFGAIAASALDPAECYLNEVGSAVIIGHNRSGSILRFLQAKGNRLRYEIHYDVSDGHHYRFYRDLQLEKVIPSITQWANEVKEITDAPDLWAEMRHTRDFAVDIQRTDSANTPFTKDEQRQIVVELKAITEQVKEQFDLTSEQIAHIDEWQDEVTEASERIGRKDWRLLAYGTIINLVVTDALPPEVARHILSMFIQVIAHLFLGGSGPTGILS
jgi:hypothetical protein